jgi:hypothetical protein
MSFRSRQKFLLTRESFRSQQHAQAPALPRNLRLLSDFETTELGGRHFFDGIS